MNQPLHAADRDKHPFFVGVCNEGVIIYPGTVYVSSQGRDFTELKPKVNGADAVDILVDTATPSVLTGTDGVVFLKLGKFNDNYTDCEVFFEASLPDDDDDYAYLKVAEVDSGRVAKQWLKSDLTFLYRVRPKLWWAASIIDGSIKVEDGLVLTTTWNTSPTNPFPTHIFKRQSVSGVTLAVAENATIWLHAVFVLTEVEHNSDLVTPVIYSVTGGRGGDGGGGGDGGSGGEGGQGGIGGSGGVGGSGGSGGNGGAGGAGGDGGNGGDGGKGGDCPAGTGSGSGECDCPGGVGSDGTFGGEGGNGLPGQSGMPGGPGGSGGPGFAGVTGALGQPGQSGQPGNSGNSGLPGTSAEITVYTQMKGYLRFWQLSSATLKAQASPGTEDALNCWVPIVKRLAGADPVKFEQYTIGAPITLHGATTYKFY